MIISGAGTLFTGTSPASATTSIIQSVDEQTFRESDFFILDCTLIGGTGGTLDLYIQRKIAADTWFDWLHFPQLAAGITSYLTIVPRYMTSGMYTVGKTNDAGAGTPALAAQNYVDMLPFTFQAPGTNTLRLMAVAGAGTSVGAAQLVRFTAYKES